MPTGLSGNVISRTNIRLIFSTVLRSGILYHLCRLCMSRHTLYLIINHNRLIYYNVTAIKVIWYILVVLIHTYFFCYLAVGSKNNFILARLSFFFMAPQVFYFILLHPNCCFCIFHLFIFE